MNFQLRRVLWLQKRLQDRQFAVRKFMGCGLMGVGILGSLTGGVALGNPRLSHFLGQSAVAMPASSVAQVDPNTGFTGVQIPYSSIRPVNGKVNIRFINETGSAIEYQVIGDTEYRSLPGRSEMTLENLGVPTTFTFRRADNGFLQVTLYPNAAAGTLMMRVRETPNFAEDRTSVYVDANGGVYLN